MAVNWAEIFSRPENTSALIKTGADVVGGLISGNAMNQKAQQDRQYSEKDTARERQFGLLGAQRTQENADFGASQSQLDEADQTVLGAMGKSPLQFQQERMKMNAIADALQGGGPSNLTAHLNPVARGLDMSKFRPSAAAEQPYWDAVAQASKGRFNGAGMGSIYGGPDGASADARSAGIAGAAGDQFQQQWADHRAANNANFGQAMGMADRDYASASAAEQDDKDDRGGFWGKVGGALKFAAPIAASFIPGVGPALGMAIAAGGSAAGTKMQGGSWGDALKSGGASAAMSGLSGALGKVAPKVFGAGAGAPKLDPNSLVQALQPIARPIAQGGRSMYAGAGSAAGNIQNAGGFRLG